MAKTHEERLNGLEEDYRVLRTNLVNLQNSFNALSSAVGVEIPEEPPTQFNTPVEQMGQADELCAAENKKWKEKKHKPGGSVWTIKHHKDDVIESKVQKEWWIIIARKRAGSNAKTGYWCDDNSGWTENIDLAYHFNSEGEAKQTLLKNVYQAPTKRHQYPVIQRRTR